MAGCVLRMIIDSSKPTASDVRRRSSKKNAYKHKLCNRAWCSQGTDLRALGNRFTRLRRIQAHILGLSLLPITVLN